MYHVGRNGQQTGPFSVEQLKEMAATGQLSPTDLVWKEGMAGWEPASTIPDVFTPAAPSVTSTPVTSTPSYSSPAPATESPQSQYNPNPGPAPLAQATVLPPVAGAGGPKPNGMALTGMILGIVSILAVCCCYGFPFNIAGIIFSVIGLNQIKANPSQQGKNMAVAGLWCSIASIVLGIILLAVALAGNAINWQEMMKGVK